MYVGVTSARSPQLLGTRSVWSRHSLVNQFPPADARTLLQTKELFALATYTFADGPWRDSLVRFGYDPRTDRESRFFQRIHLRSKASRTLHTRRAFKAEYGDAQHGRLQTDTRQVGADESARRSHVFDGKTAPQTSSTFQLCDVTDAAIVPYIHVASGSDLRGTPDVRAFARSCSDCRLPQAGTRPARGTRCGR